MKKFKSFLKKIFCLPPLPTAVIAAPSFIFVFIMLGIGGHPVLEYLSYALSAYALVITITGMPAIIEAAGRVFQESPLINKLRGIPIIGRYLDDGAFRAEVSLYSSVAINSAYVVIKLFSGIYYRSLWFTALAFYYIFLAAMRFLLLHYVHKNVIGAEYIFELKRYRLCGVLLLILDQALAVIVTLVVVQNKGFEYGGYLIYAMAFYSFYIVITSIINVIKYRRYNSPVLSAAKAVNLTAALVSILSLETAMISQFGSADDPGFRRVMTAVTGFFVFVFVLGMAIFMIVKSSKKLKEANSYGR